MFILDSLILSDQGGILEADAGIYRYCRKENTKGNKSHRTAANQLFPLFAPVFFKIPIHDVGLLS